MELEKFLHLPVKDRSIINNEPEWKPVETAEVIARDPRVTSRYELGTYSIQAVAVNPESRILWYIREGQDNVLGMLRLEDIYEYKPRP